MAGPTVLSTRPTVRGDNLGGEAFRVSHSHPQVLGLRLVRAAKAINQYNTDLEFLRGARDILKGLMAMNHVGWVHRDVSASNCLLSYDSPDGPSLILDMELAKKIDMQAPASNTAISGTAQFMARALLGSLIDQEDSDFVHLPQYDLESLVYVLAYAVMKKECIIKPVTNSATKLAEMKKIYHQAFGHGTIHMIEHARNNFLKTWKRYQLVVAGEGAPSALHEIVLALLIQVNNQYISQVTSTLDEDDDNVPQAVPMNGKRMRRVFKRAIVRQKASLKDTSPDSDVDANYD